jgi:hypothetical protein
MQLFGVDCCCNFTILVYIAPLFVQMTSELGNCDRVLFGGKGVGVEITAS